MTLLHEHFVLLCSILPSMFYFYFNGTLVYVPAQRSGCCICSAIRGKLPGIKGRKATVSPSSGFAGGKRGKQRPALRLPAKLGQSGTGNLSVKMKMCPVYASYLLSASEHPQRAETGFSQETEACHLIVTAGLTLASVAGWGPRV